VTKNDEEGFLRKGEDESGVKHEGGGGNCSHHPCHGQQQILKTKGVYR